MKTIPGTNVRLYLNDVVVKGEQCTEVRFRDKIVHSKFLYIENEEEQLKTLKASLGLTFDVKVMSNDKVLYHNKCELKECGIVAAYEGMVTYYIDLHETN